MDIALSIYSIPLLHELFLVLYLVRIHDESVLIYTPFGGARHFIPQLFNTSTINVRVTLLESNPHKVWFM